MVGWLAAVSIKFRLLVLTLAAGVLLLGFTVLPRAAVDVLPEFTPPYVEIQTEALGLSASEVEQLITVPLEADLLNGVEDVDIIRSRSVAGLSSIVMVFTADTDIHLARARVQERMTQAHALPQVSKPPTMLQPLSSSSRLLMVSLDSDELTSVERSVIARWTVKPHLMGVPGVANVAIWGQRERQLQVQVDPAVLQAKGVTLRQVIETTGNAQIVSPLSFLEASTPGTGGFIETAQQRLQVRHVMDALASPAELGKIPVDDAESVRLADVATIIEHHQPLIGDAVVSGRGDGLLLVVEKFPGADTTEVTAAVEAALEQLKPGLSGMQVDSSLFRPASYLADALDNLRLALVAGAILLLLALVAWFRNWRTLLLCVVSIPVALTAAAVVLALGNATFSAITFVGLAAGALLVTDDAVSGADGLARRMRSPAGEPAGPDLVAAVCRSRAPVGYAAAIAVLSVVPVLIMQGRPGAFFEPLALAYVAAAAASLLVSLTVVPAAASLLFARPRAHPATTGPVRGTAWYPRAVATISRVPKAAYGVLAVMALFAVIALPLAGSSLIPAFKDRDVLVRLDAAPGTSLDAMTTAVSSVAGQLRDVAGVESVGGHVGRAVTGDQIVDVNSSEIWVRIKSDADYDATLDALERVVGGVQGMSHEVLGYSGKRIRDVGAVTQGGEQAAGGLDLLTGSAHPLVVRVYGEDLTVMREKAQEIQRALAGIDGVVNARAVEPQTQEAIEIEVDVAKAQAMGIKPGDVRRAEATLVQGIQVGSIFEGQKVFDVLVQGTASTRQNIESVRNLVIDTPAGGHVRLADVADVRIASVPTAIERDAVARRLDVVADLDGRTPSSAADAARRAVAAVDFPLEHHAEVLVSSTDGEIDGSRVIWFAIGVLIAVVLLLQAAFRSWRLGALALLTLPAALSGGVVVALVQGLSIGAVAGLLAVFGVAARNALLLFREAQEPDPQTVQPEASAVRTASTGRVSGVIGSFVALAALCLPVAVLGPRAGLEILHPMSLVVLAGLVSSTLVALFALPVLGVRGGASPPQQRVDAPDERPAPAYGHAS